MSVLLFLATTLIGGLLYYLIKSTRRPANYPPGPDFIPCVGNTHQLRKEAVVLGGQHLVFEKWAQQYNSNILGLKLGSERVVVVLSYPLVREVHLGEVFEGRPDNFFLRLRTMGIRRGITCTDGQLWYEHRNFAMKQMRHVGYGRTQMEQHIEKETQSLLQFIGSNGETPIWPGSFLAPSVLNVLWCLTAGKRIERDDKQLLRLLELLSKRSKAFDVSGGVLAQFAWLRYLAPNKTGYNLIQQLNHELHSFFMENIIEHKARMGPENEESDLIFAYLKEMRARAGQEDSTFNETQLTMSILDFFIAGSQTTSNTLDLALMMLAVRQDIQTELYKEVHEMLQDSVSSKEEYPHLSARPSYPYMDAFIMEVQRFFHITPITGPRRALWNTTLAGYDIPKDTTILIGLRSVLMDKDHWSDPECFRPARFIDQEGKTLKDEYFMPFGQGRRRCLGDALARACLFSFLIKIVQHYSIQYEGDATAHSLQLQPGITLSPKPYLVRFSKRENSAA